MTRGQEALIMDTAESPSGSRSAERVDLSRFDLPVLAASAHELGAHEEVLAQMDKASGGKTVWRQLAS